LLLAGNISKEREYVLKDALLITSGNYLFFEGKFMLIILFQFPSQNLRSSHF
jgi:hypothetical protein